MKSYGYNSSESEAILVEQSTPTAMGRDLLVKIEAIAINPVDTKVKARLTEHQNPPKVVGYDAMGTVIATGDEVEYFKVGDKVFYAGDISRPGCYASHQLVDERIVGPAPKTLTPAQSASMPLTSITAWEALFSRLKIVPELDKGKSILIIGAAGGVGSIAIQLAKKLVNMTVVATASRSESEQWCRDKGADHVINHQQLGIQYRALGLADPDYILCLNNTDQHFEAMADLIAPQGLICSIVECKQKHDIDLLKSKSAGFVWEFMFTRPMFKTHDMNSQHHLLSQLSELLDNGVINHNLTETLGQISPETLQQAHEQILSGKTIGKIALLGCND